MLLVVFNNQSDSFPKYPTLYYSGIYLTQSNDTFISAFIFTYGNRRFNSGMIEVYIYIQPNLKLN